ncbi:MAG: MoaD/ThiS family protein [Bacteroidota bacterium]
MPKVKFTYALKRFYPDLDTLELNAATVNEILPTLEEKFPGICAYIVDDQGSLRKHVNIFVDGKLIEDKKSLSDQVQDNSEVYIFQALSGG